MRLTLTTGQRDVLTLVEDSFTADALAQGLAVEVGPKEGEALIPALFRPCPPRCNGSGKDCGGGRAHRLNANVYAMTGLGVDLDHLTTNELERIVTALAERGLEFYFWHTHSHRPPDDARGRLLLPFAELLPLEHPKQWSGAGGAWEQLVGHLGLPASADNSCRDPARVYYLPRKPREEDERESVYFPGNPLDWRTVVTLSEAPPTVELEVMPGALEDLSRPVDMKALRERIGRTSREEVQRVLRGEAPAEPPTSRRQGPSRYEAWRSVTAAVSLLAEDWEASSAILEVLRLGYSAEVAAAPEDHTPWDTVVSLLESARADAPRIRAEREAVRAKKKAADARALESIRALRFGAREPVDEEGPALEVPAVPVPPAAPAAPAAPSGDDWKSLVQWRPSKEGGPSDVMERYPDNATMVLSYHPDWSGVLRFNELSQNVEVWGGPFAHEGRAVRPLFDTDGAAVADWLALHGLRLQESVVWSRILLVAHDHSYDPLKDYLGALTWDGTPRVHGWLAEYLKAPTVDEEGNDITEHLRTVGSKWLISAVARGLNPGCKVDVMLTLESPEQGKRKSTALAILGGEWFTDSQIAFEGNDTLQLIHGSWIVELQELSALTKSEVEQQRAFLSRSVDKFRPPYGRATQVYPRRCAFAGSTNKQDYLQDEAGNRRHWPVRVGNIDIEALRRDRDQIWAEAVCLYRAGVKWWLDEAEEAAAAAQTELRMVSDTVMEEIEQWLLTKAPEKRPVYLTAGEICSDILEEPVSRGHEKRIARAARRLGLERVTIREGSRRRRVYRVPAALREAPKRENLTPTGKLAAARQVHVVKGEKR